MGVDNTMIVEKNFLNKLKDLGLNSYEAKIWTALLSRGVASAGELSDISNVPRSRSYDVLENLEKKGFVVMKLGKPIKYIALPPEDVLERVKKNIENEAKKESSSIDKLKSSEILKELNTLHKQGIDIIDPLELSGNLKSRNHVYGQLSLMIKNAQKSICIMTTAQGLVRKADVFKNLLYKAKRRNVKIQIAAPITSESENAAKMLASVAEIRHVDEVKARFYIVDDKEITFTLLDDSAEANYDMGVWVNTPFFAAALKQMFDIVWNESKIKVTV